jgi:hypothetical protein
VEPRAPVPAPPPSVLLGSLCLSFDEDLPHLDVLVQGQPVLTCNAGPQRRSIDNLMPGWYQVTVRSDEREVQGNAHVAAGRTTTVEMRLPPVRPPEPRLTPPSRQATGTLVLDLPQDHVGNRQILLDGEERTPTFTTSQALGFVLPVGPREVRVRQQSREFVRQVHIREAAHTTVVVSFPPLRLLLEFIEEIPEDTAVWFNDVPARPISRGRRCWEFEIEPGKHSVLVRAGKRESRSTVIVDGSRMPPLTVVLGRCPSVSPVAIKEQDRPIPPPESKPPLASTPDDVWRAGGSLCNQRVRIVGMGKIHSALNGRYVIRFYDSQRIIVDCSIDSAGAGPLVGKVNDDEYRVVTLEGTVRSTRQTTVEVGEGKVFWVH